MARYRTIFDRWAGASAFIEAELKARGHVDAQQRAERERKAKLAAFEAAVDGTHMEEGGAGAAAAQVPDDERWPRECTISDGVCTITGDAEAMPLAVKTQFLLNEMWACFECDDASIDPGEIEKDHNGILGV